jgi:hypothetical protein|tara:strand:+ start:605 stop:772 length:168 start_codon:yes stop_codon:yes gene_type:complete
MAKIVTESVVITFSKIVKDSESNNSDIAGIDIQQALEQVAQELAGESVVVEVVKA